MSMWRSTPRGRQRTIDDEGFTLVEVVAALVLLGIVATASLYFFIGGTRSSSHLQRTQNAVAVANEAMELAYAMDPKNNGAGTSGLVLGRRQVDVTAAWSAMVPFGVDGLSDTYPLWDPAAATAPNSDGAAVDISFDREHSGQKYHVTILVGSCFRPSSNLATNQVCGKLPSITADPGDAGTPAGMVRMIRVIAVVTWDPIGGECTGGECTYQLSGLVERSGDLKWNQVVEPVATDDFETFTQGETRTINVLANDVIGPVTTNPVSYYTNPAAGQGTVSLASNGMFTYTAPSGASGFFTFTYRIKDARGAQSDTAKVTITVPPQSTNDTAYVISGKSTPINVTANDKGSPASIEIVTPPSKGTATVSGLSVVYTPAIGSGTDSFQYRYTDGAGQVSPTAGVQVLVETLTVGPRTIDVTGPSVATDLKSVLVGTNSNPNDLQVIVAAGTPPTIGTLKVGTSTYAGTSLTGPTITFTPSNSTIGEYTFTFQLKRVSSGVTTDPQTATVRVFPYAAPDGPLSVRVKRTVDLLVGTNDRPTTFPTGGQVAVQLGDIAPSCGTWDGSQTGLSTGRLRLQTPTSPINNCWAEYQLVGTGALSGMASEVVTVSYKVTS